MRKRFNEPIGMISRNADGDVIDSGGLDDEHLQIVERRLQAFRLYNRTGNRSYLVDAGLIPDEDEPEG